MCTAVEQIRAKAIKEERAKVDAAAREIKRLKEDLSEAKRTIAEMSAR